MNQYSVGNAVNMPFTFLSKCFSRLVSKVAKWENIPCCKKNMKINFRALFNTYTFLYKCLPKPSKEITTHTHRNGLEIGN